MKKITALLLVALMLAAMSVAVFARYEVCPECNGRMTETVKSTYLYTKPCKVSDDPTMTDEWYKDTTTLRCTSCGYYETYTGLPCADCHH